MTPLSFKEWMTHHPGECIEHYMGLHDSLFEAGRYDMLTDIYSGMFLYMPSDPMVIRIHFADNYCVSCRCTIKFYQKQELMKLPYSCSTVFVFPDTRF
ncbi:hypothetical protein ACIXBO_15930 [Bacteroides fragilis]|nr:hypothetical protein [Bacteroides fragilis]MCY6285214.1 hypothetical protein [Bacteroides fragilis]